MHSLTKIFTREVKKPTGTILIPWNRVIPHLYKEGNVSSVEDIAAVDFNQKGLLITTTKK